MRYVSLIVLLILFACGQKDPAPKEVDWNTDKSTDLNKNLAIEEEIQIKLYLEQHRDWKMVKTGTGLQYFVYKTTEGDSAQVGQVAQVEMTISLLDGKEVYRTAEDELDEFVIDRSEIESGIHEGIKKMKVGESAKMILPSHLAHGLIGDFKKIPPLSVLVVDIKLIAVK
jgi:FKBP-type peptidyl-prolyl cis-trans isomerase FkpA